VVRREKRGDTSSGQEVTLASSRKLRAERNLQSDPGLYFSTLYRANRLFHLDVILLARVEGCLKL
jgi:hypothetical protein